MEQESRAVNLGRLPWSSSVPSVGLRDLCGNALRLALSVRCRWLATSWGIAGERLVPSNQGSRGRRALSDGFWTVRRPARMRANAGRTTAEGPR